MIEVMMFNLSKLFFFLVLTTCTACSPIRFSSTSNLPTNFMKEMNMPITENLPIKNITLVPREERIPPKGVSPHPNRDIGFADVFVHLENSQETIIKIKIQKIEIRNASDSKLQDFSFVPQTVELKPLENSELVFHLSNKTGYVGQDKVKAVLAYQVKNQVRVIESEPVTVNNN